MCLTSVSEETIPDANDVVERWQVLIYRNDKYYSFHFGFNYEANKWYESEKNVGFPYKIGFHAFLTQEEAERYLNSYENVYRYMFPLVVNAIVKRCQYKHLKAKGTIKYGRQKPFECEVYNDRMIPK